MHTLLYTKFSALWLWYAVRVICAALFICAALRLL
jgi:hypothetical protein